MNKKEFIKHTKILMSSIGTNNNYSTLILNSFLGNVSYNIDRQVYNILYEILNYKNINKDIKNIFKDTPPIYKFINQYNNNDSLVIVPYSNKNLCEPFCSVEHINIKLYKNKKNIVFFNLSKFLNNDRYIKILSLFHDKNKIIMDFCYSKNQILNKSLIYFLLYVDTIFLGNPNYHYHNISLIKNELNVKINLISNKTNNKIKMTSINSNFCYNFSLEKSSKKIKEDSIAIILNLPNINKTYFDDYEYKLYKEFITTIRRFFNNIYVIYKSYKISHIQEYLLTIDIDYKKDLKFDKIIDKKNIKYIIDKINNIKADLSIEKIIFIELHSFKSYVKNYRSVKKLKIDKFDYNYHTDGYNNIYSDDDNYNSDEDNNIINSYMQNKSESEIINNQYIDSDLDLEEDNNFNQREKEFYDWESIIISYTDLNKKKKISNLSCYSPNSLYTEIIYNLNYNLFNELLELSKKKYNIYFLNIDFNYKILKKDDIYDFINIMRTKFIKILPL